MPTNAVPPKISVRNLQRAVRFDLAGLRKSAQRILESVLRVRPGKRTQLRRLEEISVLLVSDERMAKLHRQFLNQSGPTDVLTFDHGEIFISVQTGRRNARAFANSLAGELGLYVAHGLLHLHGFDDRTESGAREMAAVQEKILVAIK